MTQTKKKYKDKCKCVKVTFYLKDKLLYEHACAKKYAYRSIEKYVKALIAKDVHEEQQNEEMEQAEALCDALAFLDERK